MSCCLEILYDHYSFDEFSSTIVFSSINRRSRIIKRYTTLIAVYQSQMRSNRKFFSNNNLQISSPYVLLLMCIISSWDNNCFRLFCNFQQFLHTKCNKRFSFNLFCMKIISMWNENCEKEMQNNENWKAHYELIATEMIIKCLRAWNVELWKFETKSFYRRILNAWIGISSNFLPLINIWHISEARVYFWWEIVIILLIYCAKNSRWKFISCIPTSLTHFFISCTYFAT